MKTEGAAEVGNEKHATTKGAVIAHYNRIKGIVIDKIGTNARRAFVRYHDVRTNAIRMDIVEVSGDTVVRVVNALTCPVVRCELPQWFARDIARLGKALGSRRLIDYARKNLMFATALGRQSKRGTVLVLDGPIRLPGSKDGRRFSGVHQDPATGAFVFSAVEGDDVVMKSRSDVAQTLMNNMGSWGNESADKLAPEQKGSGSAARTRKTQRRAVRLSAPDFSSPAPQQKRIHSGPGQHRSSGSHGRVVFSHTAAAPARVGAVGHSSHVVFLSA